MNINIKLLNLLNNKSFEREIERFVNPSGPVSKQIALENIQLIMRKYYE